MTGSQVLVVEDEMIVAKAIQNELCSMGYLVPAIARSGDEALDLAGETHPDVILMDIVLRGERDGISAAEEVRNRFDIPVIFLTAYGDDATILRARKAEPFGYLLKPYEEKELQTTIEMALYKHRMERQLKDSKRWLETILSSTADAVIATDAKQDVRLINAAAERLLNCKSMDVLGKDLSYVLPLHHPSDANVLDSARRRACSLGKAAPLPDDLAVVGPNGCMVPIEGSAAPMHDADDIYTGLVIAFRDISARKQVEELQRENEAYLRHTQKMAAVSRLAGGVAHEFNNLLTAILGNASLVLESLPLNDPQRPLLVNVETASLRAAEVVQQLLAFARRSSVRLETANLNDVVEPLLDIFRRTCDPRVSVLFQPASDLWPVQFDRTQITELLRNLCLNAFEAMPEAGRLSVETSNITLAQEYLHRHGRGRPGDYVRLRVSDTGQGMPPAVQQQLFEPFFTTKQFGEGTGLGLALVYGIVEDHHGWIECQSAPVMGTRFDVYLPRYGNGTDLPVAPRPRARPRGTVATILLADDEPMVRELAATILQSCGFRVLLAEDGIQALEIHERERNHIDLIILDLDMPRLSGQDAHRRLVQTDPTVRVLFSSGYFAEDTAVNVDDSAGFISKPYRHDELINAVRSALEIRQDGSAEKFLG